MKKTHTHLLANWPAPKHIKALTTTCHMDLMDLKSHFHLPDEPIWLNQTHSNICVNTKTDDNRDADAAVAKHPKQVLAIRTADCLPIVLCNQEGTEIAAIHAGWRGLCSGVIENTLETMDSDPTQLMAWLGPAICNHCFEVGPEVPEQFLVNYPFALDAFTPKNDEKYLGDLSKIASLILTNHGVNDVFCANQCTFEEKNTYFSYRREKQTGRIATLIWFKPS